MKFVDVVNSQKIGLKGVIYESAGKETCALFVPGMAGNIFENYFISVLGEECMKNGITFLCGHNQGSFHMCDLPYENKYIRRGAAFELFDDCLYDLDAWIEYILSLGYKKIILIGHSLGCSKIVYYLSEKNIKEISSYILLAPVDAGDKNRFEEKDKKILELAMKNVKNGEGEKIIGGLFLGYYILSSKTFIDQFNNMNRFVFPYTKNKGSYERLKSIQKPMLAIAGENDKLYSLKTEDSLKDIILGSGYENVSYEIINEAGHSFKGYEEDLCEKIIKFLNK